MRIKRIHHITLGVRDIEGARRTFDDLFSEQTTDPYGVPAFGIRALDVGLGDVTLQLASPASGDNPLQRFLERKGEGVYNIAVEVDDLDGAVAELAAKGIRVSEPVDSQPGMRSAFVTMSATHGMSLQLVELAPRADREAWSAPSLPEATASDEPASPPRTSPPVEPAKNDEWSDSAPPRPVDLTPDEWSDTD